MVAPGAGSCFGGAKVLGRVGLVGVAESESAVERRVDGMCPVDRGEDLLIRLGRLVLQIANK